MASNGAPTWKVIKRAYEQEKAKASLEQVPSVHAHPLLPAAPKEEAAKSKKDKPAAIVTDLSPRKEETVTPVKILDPLSDPLSMMSVSSPLNLTSSFSTQANKSETNNSANNNNKKAEENVWATKKQQILQKYAFHGDITLSSSAYNEFDGSGVEDGSVTRYLDKYAQRLATLEKRSFADDKVKLTQLEYEEHIHKLSTNLQTAWDNDERVGSLKIAIKLAKLLADTTIPQFYPTIFVMITNELDKFGTMVFQRLRSKAIEGLAMEDTTATTAMRSPLSPTSSSSNSNKKAVANAAAKFPENFTTSDVPSLARETCRNWFYKIACIRELLPRLYVEAALIRCYRFLMEPADIPPVLSRLASTIRGLGHPLLANYARMYLNVVSTQITTLPGNNNNNNNNNNSGAVSAYNLTLVQDMIFHFKNMKAPLFLQTFEKQTKVSLRDFYRLLSPGVDWLIQAIAPHVNNNKQLFQTLLTQYRDCCNDTLLLKSMIDHFDISLYSHALPGMVALIKAAEPTYVSINDVFASLGKQLLKQFPSEQQQKLLLLNEVWKHLAADTNMHSYIKCCVVWIEVIQKHFSQREMVIVLADLGQRLQVFGNGDTPEYLQKHLEGMMLSLLADDNTHSQHGSLLLSSENVLKIIDSFSATKRVHICKEILIFFRRSPPIGDAVLINTMFYVSRVLHDSIDSMSSDGEKAHIASLLASFVQKIDFGRDLEQQLNTYTECRALFCNLDSIKNVLVLCVCALGLKVVKMTKGKHTKKTASFAKSCLAYCFITIPSIEDVFRRLELLVHCAQVALLNQCLPQTDSFLKTAVALIAELPSHHESADHRRVHSEERLTECLRQLLAFLVVVPGHPEHGPFYLLRGLLLSLSSFPWQAHTDCRLRVHMDMLALLATLQQQQLPYRLANVDSNDGLYCVSDDYCRELSELIGSLMTTLLQLLTSLGERTELTAKLTQARCCLDLCNQVVARFEIDSVATAQFAINLLLLSRRNSNNNNHFDRQQQAYYASTVQALKSAINNNNNNPALLSTIAPLLKDL